MHKTLTGNIRRRDALSLMLLSLVMNKIIDKIKSVEGYKKNTGKTICYAEDVMKTVPSHMV